MSHRPITVALLTTGELHIGGVEQHLCTLIGQSDPSRYRWLLVGSASPEFAQRTTALGAQFIPWVSRRAFDRQAITRLAAILRDNRVDLVHAHFPRAGFLGALAARRQGLPVVTTIHGPSYHYDAAARNPIQGWLYRRLEAYCIRRLFAQTIYVSRRVYTDACLHGIADARTAVVIENGVDLTRFHHSRRDALRQAFGLHPEETVITCVGRLSPEKGQDLLIDAMLTVLPLRKHTQLWLVGDGPLYKALAARLETAGLQDHCRCWGFRDDVADLLVASDIAVLPSRYENFPLSLLEALAAGLPCVATDVGDNGDVIRQGIDGLVIPPGDSQAIAHACQTLIDNSEMRETMRGHALTRAREYAQDTMVNSICAIYAPLINRPIRQPGRGSV